MVRTAPLSCGLSSIPAKASYLSSVCHQFGLQSEDFSSGFPNFSSKVLLLGICLSRHPIQGDNPFHFNQPHDYSTYMQTSTDLKNCVTEEYTSEFRDWQDQGHLSALCTYWMSLLPGKSHSWHTSYQSSEHPLTRHVFEASQLQEPVGHFFLLEVQLESSLKLNYINELLRTCSETMIGFGTF